MGVNTKLTPMHLPHGIYCQLPLKVWWTHVIFYHPKHWPATATATTTRSGMAIRCHPYTLQAISLLYNTKPNPNPKPCPSQFSALSKTRECAWFCGPWAVCSHVLPWGSFFSAGWRPQTAFMSISFRHAGDLHSFFFPNSALFFFFLGSFVLGLEIQFAKQCMHELWWFLLLESEIRRKR